MFPTSSAGASASGGAALYSGLGVGIFAVATLVAAVMLYRKNSADAIDSSALAFNFKTATPGETVEAVPSLVVDQLLC